MRTFLKLPSPATVIAVVALVAATSGVSYAAGTIGASDLEKNAVTSKKIKNGTIKVKDIDAGAVTSLQGAKGATGPAGPAGPAGAQGPAGPLPDTLPSGKTLRGAWGLASVSVGTNEAIQDAISFPFPLATNPTVRLINVGDAPPAQCPGTAANPQALPGNLCVYQGFRSNLGNLSSYGASDGSAGTRFGIMVYARNTAVGNAETSGTWAVTAP